MGRGRARIDYLLEWNLDASVLGDKSAALVRTASRDIIMGLVNRAMEPGCAWPRLTILWGPQGLWKKQLSLELLLPAAEAWYYESHEIPAESDEELFDNTAAESGSSNSATPARGGRKPNRPKHSCPGNHYSYQASVRHFVHRTRIWVSCGDDRQPHRATPSSRRMPLATDDI